MSKPKDWREEIAFVVDFMRELSRQTDPQTAAALYGTRLRQGGFVTSDGFLSVSRRDLQYPAYRITRSSTWKEAINPWLERHRLPVHTTGLLSEIVYSNDSVIIDDLPNRYTPDDPAAKYFQGMNFLQATPNFDDGEALNVSIILTRSPEGMPRDMIPMIIMQSNLWGRSVLNSVLRRELKSAYDALDHELKTVGNIQRSLLPISLPEIPGLEMAADYETSERAGGDYYDFFPLAHGRWGIFIADVSGHGIPAAVRMAITHAIAHTRPDTEVSPSGMLSYLNSILERRYIGQTGAFVTAFYAIYDSNSHRLSYSSAGHPPPRLARGEGVSELNCRGGLPLGIEALATYPECEIKLHSGDRLVFYTDGVSEAFDKNRALFGTDPIDAAALADHDARQILDRILADLKRHVGDAAVADDRTLLVIDVK